MLISFNPKIQEDKQYTQSPQVVPQVAVKAQILKNHELKLVTLTKGMYYSAIS